MSNYMCRQKKKNFWDLVPPCVYIYIYSQAMRKKIMKLAPLPAELYSWYSLLWIFNEVENFNYKREYHSQLTKIIIGHIFIKILYSIYSLVTISSSSSEWNLNLVNSTFSETFTIYLQTIIHLYLYMHDFFKYVQLRPMLLMKLIIVVR